MSQYEKHGLINHPLYTIWQNIRQRCYNPNHIRYKHYGGKGVYLCEEWQAFSAFYNWAVENGYQEGLTIDRIDNKIGYCSSNCRWISLADQSKNRTNVNKIEYNGGLYTVPELAAIGGLPVNTLWNRIKRGDPVEILLVPARSLKYVRRKITPIIRRKIKK